MELRYLMVVGLSLLPWKVDAHEVSVGKEQEKYKELFITKRSMHIEAMESFQKLNEEKRNKMLHIVVEKLFTVLEENIRLLSTNGFQPGSPFPEDERMREVYAVVLENSIFFSDMALRYPDNVHSMFDSKKKWKILIQQAYALLKESQVLSSNDQKNIDLAAQELRIIDRKPDFENPYSRQYQEELATRMKDEAQKMQSEQKKQQKKRRKRRKKEPRLSDEF